MARIKKYNEHYPEVDYDSLEFDSNKKFFKDGGVSAKPITFSTDEGVDQIRDMLDSWKTILNQYSEIKKSLKNVDEKIKKAKDNVEMYEERLLVYYQLPRIGFFDQDPNTRRTINYNNKQYTISDEKIEIGDWYLTFDGERGLRNDIVIGEPRKCEDDTYSFKYCKKIIK